MLDSSCRDTTGVFKFRRNTLSRIPASGPGAVPGTDPVLQAQTEGGQGQHGEVPAAHTAVAARAGTPSYAGAGVEVLEGLDGRLSVRHEGRIVAAQEAPPSPVFLRNGRGPSASVPVPPSGVSGLSERWIETLEPLHSRAEDENDPSMIIDEVAAAGKPAASSARKPTFLQKARWKAIQKAKRKLDFTQNLKRATDAPALARRHLWLTSEGFDCPQLIQIFRNSLSLYTIHSQTPSLMPLKMRKVQARGCRCERLSGNWECTGAPSRNTWRPRVLQRDNAGWFPQRRHLIPSRPNRVTFMLNT